MNTHPYIFIYDDILKVSDKILLLIESLEFSPGKIYNSTDQLAQIELKKSYDARLGEDQSEAVTELKAFISAFWQNKRLCMEPHYFSVTDLLVQKYYKNEGYFRLHEDSSMIENRQMAFIYYLNTVDEGGETVFPVFDIKVKPIKNRLLIFPAHWSFLHEGTVPISSDKLVCTGFLVID